MPRSVAELLEAHREDIIQRWTKRVEGRFAPAGLSRSELVDSLPDFLNAMVDALRRRVPVVTEAPTQELAFLGELHGRQRYRVGSDINAVVWEYGVLRDVLLELLAETGQPLPVAEWHVISHAITTGIAEAVSHFAEERDKALRASEATLRAIIDHAPAYIYMKDTGGRYLLANKSWESAFHGGRDVRGKTDHDVFPPHIANMYRANDLAVIQTRAPIEAEEADGERVYLSHKFPLSDAEGRPYAVCAISTDITARKRLETERARAVAALERGDACAVLDRDWRLVFLNHNYERLTQQPREALLGHVLWELFPMAAQPSSPYWREYHRVMEQRVPSAFEAYYAPLDKWTAETAYPIGDDGIVVFFRDITEKKRTQAARDLFLEAGRVLTRSLDLKDTLRSLATIVSERLADYCLVDLLGDDGELHRLEAATQDEALRPLLQRAKAYSPRVGTQSPMAIALERGEVVAIPSSTPEHLRAAAVDEEHLAILEAIAPQSSIIVPLVARGRKLGVITLAWTRSAPPIERYLEVARGVADQSAIAIDNAQLYQESQEAVRIREEVVGIVSHDLRNPLAAISMTATVLLKREELSPAVAKGLSRIFAAADRATRMISVLLDFTQARVGSLPLEPRSANLLELARQVVEEVQLAHPDRDIRLETAGGGQGEWDVDRVAQVITNLVGNAVQHSPPDTPVRVSARGEDGTVVLEVHNGGSPIPPEALPTLFEPFQRGHSGERGRGSVGLGLYISQQVIRGHGGHIHVRSSAEEGTTFTVRLPRHAPGSPPARTG
jgi:PAS domain S-box-containing protein